ncbi:hypothetical protein FA13DRAFT_1809104 [Coprinellus micaceus]|uniref:Uncharacterized protein n=1 Tax=Coprinellus micaceus TaxID=71717 RepID=A0A4Y7TZ88_COPMI|nr:hypothetical protein FA13DRAFT_1809104 [Coprinellus micaceus]
MAALTLVRAYQQSFDTHPNITLSIAGGCLNALGDCVAQVAEGTTRDKPDRNQYDIVRTARFFAYGATLSPFLGRWNALLESRFPLHLRRPLTHRANAAGGLIRPGETASNNPVSSRQLLKRVAADQIIMAPLGLVLFIGSMGMMEGRTRSQIKQKYQDLYGDAIVANWKVWPVAQLVNFRFMPLPYRVPFSQACGVFWTLYLSMLNSREDKKQDDRVAENIEIICRREHPEAYSTHEGSGHRV